MQTIETAEKVIMSNFEHSLTFFSDLLNVPI
jgi:hypothetical protein